MIKKKQLGKIIFNILINLLLFYIYNYFFVFLIGYHFNYNEGQLSDLSLEKLRLWPTDDQIIQIIHHSYRLACELTEFFKMIQPVDLLINNLQIVIRSHDDEVSMLHIYNEMNFSNIQENEDDISSAISNASKEIGQINNNLDDDNSLSINIFQSGNTELEIVNQSLNSLSILNNGDSGKYF